MTELYFGVSDDFAIPEFQNRRVIDEIKMVMSAFDCVLLDESGIYCSSDITTGKRYYELLLNYGVRSEEELRQNLGDPGYQQVTDDLIRANITRGLEFREMLRTRIPQYVLVNPGPFSAPGFDQEHYLYLWEWVIIKKIREAWFNENWEYSNGCTFEYAIAAKKVTPRFDYHGQALDIDRAIAKIERAVEDLKSRGFLAHKLKRNLDLIKGLL